MQIRRKRGIKVKVLIAAAIVCIVFAVFIKQQFELNSYNEKISELNTEIKTEEKRTKEIEKKAELYASDDYIEKVARDELGLVKPDEKVFVDSGSN